MSYRLKMLYQSVFGQKRKLLKKTYSQCGEDVIMSHLFHELRMPQPSFIDIGAHHPKYLNNTYFFYKNGSRGINIEPDPALIDAFKKQRADDKNLNIGIADDRGMADFYVMNEPTLNTFVKEEADRIHQEHPGYFIKEVLKIQLVPLAEVIKEHNKGVFPDLLSLDVEGLDEVILRSIDYDVTAPKVICVETISFSTKGEGVKNMAILNFLKDKGYRVYADTYINTIFVHNDTWENHFQRK